MLSDSLSSFFLSARCSSFCLFIQKPFFFFCKVVLNKKMYIPMMLKWSLVIFNSAHHWSNPLFLMNPHIISHSWLCLLVSEGYILVRAKTLSAMITEVKCPLLLFCLTYLTLFSNVYIFAGRNRYPWCFWFLSLLRNYSSKKYFLVAILFF